MLDLRKVKETPLIEKGIGIFGVKMLKRMLAFLLSMAFSLLM